MNEGIKQIKRDFPHREGSLSIRIDGKKWKLKERELRRLVAVVEEGLKAGKNKYQIINEIIQTEKVGDESEYAVYKALSALDGVAEIIAPPKWGDDDYLHTTDLIIVLAPDHYSGVTRIRFQVKSSANGLAKGKKKLRENEGIANDHDWKIFLRQKLLVFINGGSKSTPESIRQSFEDQL